ncbi:hypothetical protein Sru01_08380 [Sphaerisporangium rufum]|uniref:Uncharacterized protein n=1 Tax=Sphaerisporangium rufum TaxID=1381558 RepID=A0A919QZX0_9ACTN|nr:hypothetical protein [Sphaerisporangium rufum]GII75856.1 hypothetical protein Sru01_08380 [Sphaerisporangium rufum]
MRHLAHEPARDDAAVPEVIPLGGPHSVNPQIVGDGAALLSRALRVGFPVARGFVVPVTAAGMDVAEVLGGALREAWAAIRGSVRIAVSATCPAGGGFGASPQFYDGSTWSGLLDGLYDMLAHHRLENPATTRLPWSIVVQDVPDVRCSALVMSGHPTGWGQGASVWSGSPDPDDPRDWLGWTRRRRLRRLAREAAALAGHPVDLEVVYDVRGSGRIVDFRRYNPVPQA